MKILLISDMAPLVRHIQSLEENLQCLVHSAQTANGALDLLDDCNYDVVIIDPWLRKGESKKLSASRTFAADKAALGIDVIKGIKGGPAVFAMNVEDSWTEEELRKLGVTLLKGVPTPKKLLDIVKSTTS